MEHLPLSEGELPSAVPDCRQVQRLAELPGVRAIGASERSGQPLVVPLASLRVPDRWRGDGELIYPRDSGTAEGSFESPGGDFTFWLRGSWRGGGRNFLVGPAVGGRGGESARARPT